MKAKTIKIKTFTNRYPFVGPAIWILSAQYYLVQIITAWAWKTPYSFWNNTISDLGNTACGMTDGRYVCSPLHSLMNASFITLGVTMMVGSILLYQEFQKTRQSLIGFWFMGIAGLGSLMVGLFTANQLISLHLVGAAWSFLIGNVGLIILGLTLDLPPKLRTYSLLSGIIALTALVLLAGHIYLGIGIGGMERLTAYPQTIWLIIFGLYLSNHYRKTT